MPHYDLGAMMWMPTDKMLPIAHGNSNGQVRTGAYVGGRYHQIQRYGYEITNQVCPTGASGDGPCLTLTLVLNV